MWGADVRPGDSDHISPTRQNDHTWQGPDLYQMEIRETQDRGFLSSTRTERLTAFLWLLKLVHLAFLFLLFFPVLSLKTSSFFCGWSRPPGPRRIFQVSKSRTPVLLMGCCSPAPRSCAPLSLVHLHQLGLEQPTCPLTSLLFFAFTPPPSFQASCSL